MRSARTVPCAGARTAASTQPCSTPRWYGSEGIHLEERLSVSRAAAQQLFTALRVIYLNCLASGMTEVRLRGNAQENLPECHRQLTPTGTTSLHDVITENFGRARAHPSWSYDVYRR
jgi:hypothetical protein